MFGPHFEHRTFRAPYRSLLMRATRLTRQTARGGQSKVAYLSPVLFPCPFFFALTPHSPVRGGRGPRGLLGLPGGPRLAHPAQNARSCAVLALVICLAERRLGRHRGKDLAAAGLQALQQGTSPPPPRVGGHHHPRHTTQAPPPNPLYPESSCSNHPLRPLDAPHPNPPTPSLHGTPTQERRARRHGGA